MNNAIHSEVWAGCLDVLLGRDMVPPLVLLRMLKSLHDQLGYLRTVTAGHHGNWPTIGCRCMLVVLSAFPELRITEELSEYCLSQLALQIDDQVLPDGVQSELSPHYHDCVVRNLATAASSARLLGRELRPETLAVLRRMLHYGRQTTVPDGSMQVAFNDSDAACVPAPDASATMAGLTSGVQTDKPVLDAELFPYAGVAVLRQRADRGDLYLAFDGGPFGLGHQHEDKLGFWLHAYGRSFIVDSGRHLYDDSDVSFRPYMITTRAHSTICVDGAGQNSRGKPDTWRYDRPDHVHWQRDAGTVRALARYDLGYGPDNAIDVVHSREIVLVHDRFWVLFDRLDGVGVHDIESRFQYAPGELSVCDGRTTTQYADSNLLLWPLCTCPIDDMRVECGQLTPRSGWVSFRYNQVEPAPLLKLHARGPLPVVLAVLLWPYRGPDVPDIAWEMTASGVTVSATDTGELRIETSLLV